MEDKDQVLLDWQDKYEKAKAAYSDILTLIGEREGLYKGTRDVDSINTSSGETTTAPKKAAHTRNITFELIESQVDSSIPSPKVTALREQDEPLAREVEDSLRADLDRLPIEQLNDQMERTTPAQGGSYFLVEWDNSVRTHTTIGDLTVSEIHPQNVIPQAGVFSLRAADHIFVRAERTHSYIKKRYDVDVEGEHESESGINTTEDMHVTTEDKVTQVLCYYKNKNGGIGLFSWVNDIVLEDLEDYQARQMDKCAKCGREKPFNKDVCECGSKTFIRGKQETETLIDNVTIVRNGQPVVIPAGTKIPYYKPNVYPIVLRKNVSAFGQLLGDSDTDKIRDQQMTINQVGSKIKEKLLKGGSAVALPRGARLRKDDSEMKVWEFDNIQDADGIKVINLQPNTNFDIAFSSVMYQTAQSTLGITDSFQGKPDPTAESGKAKQLQIQQAAGRLESKRVMKESAYAELFELMFKFKLAYTDEPRFFYADGVGTEQKFGRFSRYDFLDIDVAGEFFYNDNFLFSTDPAGALGQNRQAMWEETRKNFHEGAFGNPQDPRVLLIYWKEMQELGYPRADKIIKQVAQWIQQTQQEQAAMAQQAMQAQTAQQPIQQTPMLPSDDIDSMLLEIIGGAGVGG